MNSHTYQLIRHRLRFKLPASITEDQNALAIHVTAHHVSIITPLDTTEVKSIGQRSKVTAKSFSNVSVGFLWPNSKLGLALQTLPALYESVSRYTQIPNVTRRRAKELTIIYRKSRVAMITGH